MRKTSLSEWTFSTLLAMVCASCFCMCPLFAADPHAEGNDDQLLTQELQLAREAADKRSAELDAAVAKARNELQQLRSRYAELYLQSQERNRRLEELELQAAHLLVDRQALATGDTAVEALRALEEVRQAQIDHAALVRGFQGYLSSVLDVMQPSDALRREITTRCDELTNSAQHTLKPLSRVAGRGRRDLEARSCRVLTVNDDLQVVVLDSGYASGVRRGSRWHVARDETDVAQLRVIEVRADLSAAVITDGRLDDIGPGSVVAPDRR